jgi:hypothetical protein
MDWDARQNFLARIHSSLGAENCWTRWDQDGFCWWPCRLAHYVSITVNNGRRCVSVSSRVPVIEKVRALQERADGLITSLNSGFDGVGKVRLDAASRIMHLDLDTTVRADEETDLEKLGRGMIGQIAVADRIAPRLAVMFAGRIATSSPSRGIVRRQIAPAVHQALTLPEISRLAALTGKQV